MSLSLDLGTKPKGLEIKTLGNLLGLDPLHVVHLGEYEISMKDFLCAADYVLTNTDLEVDDPRLQFVRCVKSMKIVEGYNPGRKRLEASVPPIPLDIIDEVSKKPAPSLLQPD